MLRRKIKQLADPTELVRFPFRTTLHESPTTYLAHKARASRDHPGGSAKKTNPVRARGSNLSESFESARQQRRLFCWGPPFATRTWSSSSCSASTLSSSSPSSPLSPSSVRRASPRFVVRVQGNGESVCACNEDMPRPRRSSLTTVSHAPASRKRARGFDSVASGFGLACADTSATPRRTLFFFAGSSRRAVLSQHVRAVSMIFSKDSRSIPSNYLGVSSAAGKRRPSRSLPLANCVLLTPSCLQ